MGAAGAADAAAATGGAADELTVAAPAAVAALPLAGVDSARQATSSTHNKTSSGSPRLCGSAYIGSSCVESPEWRKEMCSVRAIETCRPEGRACSSIRSALQGGRYNDQLPH